MHRTKIKSSTVVGDRFGAVLPFSSLSVALLRRSLRERVRVRFERTGASVVRTLKTCGLTLDA